MKIKPSETKWMLNNSFMVADSKKPGPIYVAPHAGNTFYKPGDNQDVGTHYIAYRLASAGGKAIISSISRERKMGIDFYRNIPDMKMAIKRYNIFGEKEKGGGFSFRKKYAWVAANENEHEHKKNIYMKFWNIVKESGLPAVFVHRQFLNPIRHPSLIDVVTFNCKHDTGRVIRDLNIKNKALFEKLMPMYRSAVSFKNHCVLFKQEIDSQFGVSMFEHKKPKLKTRIELFHKKMAKYPNLQITHRKNFSGKILKNLLDSGVLESKTPAIQLEISEFLTRLFPDIAIHISMDIVNSLLATRKSA